MMCILVVNVDVATTADVLCILRDRLTSMTREGPGALEFSW